MSDPALRTTGLVVRRGRANILRGVDLSVNAGEVVAVLGPNGAGKSTLLGAIGGLLKPEAGRVEHAGRVATMMQSPGLARRSVRANVELAMAWWGTPRAQRRARALDALTQMHADHLARRVATSLSGGEQRRVHLARAVAVSPDVLLLDEPFDGLDPYTHAALRDDTTAALRAAGGAVVVVLHERVDAWAIADRIVVIIDGTVHAQGRPQEVLDAPPTAEVARFLGYDGELSSHEGRLLTRPANVRIDATGELTATVTRTIGIEDGLRVELTTPRGIVWTRYPDFDLRTGDAVRLTIVGGAEFGA